MEKQEYKQFLLNFFDLEVVNELIDSMDEEPYHCLRLNPLKCSNKEYFSTLEVHPYINYAFYYKKEDFDAGNDPLHHAGAYYIQDASAMMVGKLLNVDKTDKILDLCAAPGGKSTFVAPFLTEGLLISNDVSNSRCQSLISNIERLGINNTIVINNEIVDISNYLQGYFDKVILDAPCSGEGMFRKDNKMSDDWSIDKVHKLVEIQKNLIIQAYKLLKRDGIMIYSTCTFNKLENEDIINHLLKNTNASLINIDHKEGMSEGINLKESVRLFPYSFKGEGHFICLVKCNDDNEAKQIKILEANISPKSLKTFKDFTNKNLTEMLDTTRLYEFNNSIYYLPNNCPNINKLHIVRLGVLLGTTENEIFKPSHQFASTFKIFKNTVNFDRNSLEVNKYLHGDTIQIKAENGYCQILVDNIPLGLGKVVNNQLKNLYPKGLRKSKI